MDKLPIDCVFHCFCCKVDGTLHSLEFLFQALMVRSLIASFNIRYFHVEDSLFHDIHSLFPLLRLTTRE